MHALSVLHCTGAQSSQIQRCQAIAPTAPTIVTPGKAGNTYSDAIILFDGTQMDAWQSQDGPAKWSLLESEGAMEVKKGTGSLRTKSSFGDVLTAY